MGPGRSRSPSAPKARPTAVGEFLAKLRRKRIIEILTGFVGGGWLVYEIIHWVLVEHYHFPEKLLDITLIILVSTLLASLI